MVQMMQPARVGGQVIALEIAAGMLESGEAEQAHMVLQTAAQIAQQETKFVLMASAAKLRYSQWLHFCKAANRGSPNSGVPCRLIASVCSFLSSGILTYSCGDFTHRLSG